MSFEDILDRHSNHTVVILWRLHKNKIDPVPGLYCQDCAKLIKWLSLDLAEDLIKAGVEVLDMMPDEENIWHRRLRMAESVKNLKAGDLLG
jgi:hypothetical protein